MSYSIDWCEICGEGSLEDDPPRVQCEECYKTFHRHCAVDAESLEEGVSEVSKEHCPYCQLTFIAPKCEHLSIGIQIGIALHSGIDLSDEQIQSFNDIRGVINLSGVTKLTERNAEALAAGSGIIAIPDLVHLDVYLASILAEFDGQLELGFRNPLTERLATALSKHRGALFLLHVTKLSTPVAAILANHKGGVLGLSDVESLSIPAARALARHKDGLTLPKLRHISPELAASLAATKGQLVLDGLDALDDLAASALAKHKGTLSLDGVVALSDHAAIALSKLKGALLMEGLVELSDSAAKALSKTAHSFSDALYDKFEKYFPVQ